MGSTEIRRHFVRHLLTLFLSLLELPNILRFNYILTTGYIKTTHHV